MVNFFIYARDYSGSTQGVKHFHTNGLKSLEEFKRHVEKINEELKTKGEPETVSKIIYLHWGDLCYHVPENEAIAAYVNLRGNMATQPQSFIRWMKKKYGICNAKNKIKLLYIVTDGMIETKEADECFQLNENINYEIVVFHAFNTDLDAIDFSVAASFFKNRCVIYRNYELYDSVDISKDYDYDKIKLNNFETEKDSLMTYIRIKFIKKCEPDARALREIGKLKKLRNRLFAEVLAKSPQEELNLETKDRDVFLHEFRNTRWYKTLVNPEQSLKVDIEKFISTLINYIVSDQKSYSFDALKFNKTFNNTVEEEAIIIDVDFAADQEIQFPDIILDDDKGIPVIILTELNLLEKIIFNKKKDSAELSSATFNKFKSTMDCPLYLLHDQDVSESIGYFYTLNVYRQLLENNVRTEPRTRRPFHGGLVLVDSDEFDKYNDYIISATYFNCKKVNYNIGLFYYVLWKNSENKEWMDKNVVERLKKYAMRRISTTVCKIGLSSFPLDPQNNTLLLTALWYCVELSSDIFKNDPTHFAHERLRMYSSVARYMIEILQYFNYSLDLNVVEKRIDLIRSVMTLKRISKPEQKYFYLLEKIFKNVNGFLVCDIEKPFNLNKLNYLKLDHKGMLSEDLAKEKVHLNDYVHLLHFVDNFCESKNDNDQPEMCGNTFRPFFTIDQSKAFYTELVKVTKRVVINDDHDPEKINITYEAVDSLEFDRILSLYNLFLNCVKDFKKYPTFSEYVRYILAKKKFHNNLVTIFPPNVHFAAEKIYSSYQNIMTTVDVSKFISLSKRFTARFNRIKAEGIVKLSSDTDINKFIIDEESKVNLNKTR